MALKWISLKVKPPEGNKKATSNKKIEANKQNAKLSTGPRTSEGKRRSSRNSLKHGLLVSDLVIRAGGLEDQAEFDALLFGLRDHWQPANLAEDLTVQEIAASYWRTRRAYRFESGDITCWGAGPIDSESNEPAIDLSTLQPSKDVFRSLLQSSRGTDALLANVEEAEFEVEPTGSIPAKVLSWLNPCKPWDPSFFTSKKDLLVALEKERRGLSARRRHLEEEELLRLKAKRDYWAIPSKEGLDRMNPYVASNVRHRYKLEERLEQLQARRRENEKAKERNAETLQENKFCETKPTGFEDGGLPKGPHSVGLEEQTSNGTAPPPIEIKKDCTTGD